MRRFHGDSDALDTINAAASAIASADNRGPQATPTQKRRWIGCWSMYSCFGSHRHRKRIGHAILPENSDPRNDTSAPQNPPQAPPPFTLPFIAPPSSPASFLQSEPPSALQSPAGLISMSASMYSPSGPASIFAIGPYAHETQLVSPPVFSTFTTEPSTAPFTPPPESVHLTTPSSPEVPFAQLFDPSLRNPGTSLQFPASNYEFNSYQLYPGSPVGQLISPSSGVSGSGTSSPFPDLEFSRFPEFHIPDPPKLLSLDDEERESGPEKGSTNEDKASRHQKHRSITLGSLKEFNFESANGGDTEKVNNNGTDWWTNGTETGKEDGVSKNWSFPVMQPNAD